MKIQLFGKKGARDAHEIRDFLKRSNIEFEYHELDPDTSDSHIPGRFRHHDLPVCIMLDGEILKKPNLRQIAERVGGISESFH